MRKHNKKVFLLVEDDANDVLLVETEFAKAGHLRLRIVSDGQHAMDYLLGEGSYTNREAYPIPDVILLDLKMPRIGGFDFLKWLHQEGPAMLRLIPIVVMSSSDEPRDVERAYALGANFYMSKPIDWRLFQERIHLLGVLWSEHAETPHVH